MNSKDDLFAFLEPFLTEHKKELFEKVLNDRTRHVTVVLEDIYQPHNASAVLRSCDCFGIQDVHIIENKNTYEVNRDIALGSAQWLNLHRHDQQAENTLDCLNLLRSKGYRIVATTPHTNDQLISELDLTEPVALVFGTEQEGISNVVMEEADAFVRIPMFGFTESYNISVAAALTLYEVTQRIRTMQVDWHLSEDDKRTIRLQWAKNTIQRVENYIHEFERRNGK